MVGSPSSISEMTVPNHHSTGVFIGLGSNLGHLNLTPLQLLDVALDKIEKGGDKIVSVSSCWTSNAWPANTGASDYTNAVCQLLPFDDNPAALLARLYSIEAELGRQRDPSNQWASRTMDLDLLDYNGLITESDSILRLPHPRIAQRDFVLLPLLEITPNWVHPITCERGDFLLRRLQKSDLTNGCVKLDQGLKRSSGAQAQSR
jgi:2-amino-4-hydroxy-6-hydroxymethyldihydropteridine diphosphokinase